MLHCSFFDYVNKIWLKQTENAATEQVEPMVVNCKKKSFEITTVEEMKQKTDIAINK